MMRLESSERARARGRGLGDVQQSQVALGSVKGSWIRRNGELKDASMKDLVDL